jgi:DNA-binding NarL/FixJ family response regulator
VHEASERKSLQQLVASVKPGVMLLDFALPGLDGLPGLGVLCRVAARTKILVLTEMPSPAEGVAVLKVGAKGYYTRAIRPPLLGKAVAAMQNGELWIERRLVNALVTGLVALEATQVGTAASSADCRLQRLTLRQRQVANAVATGASNKEIAMRLNVTERTVKAHLTEMFRNLGVLDRVHLAVLLNRVAAVGAGTEPSSATATAALTTDATPQLVYS